MYKLRDTLACTVAYYTKGKIYAVSTTDTGGLLQMKLTMNEIASFGLYVMREKLGSITCV